MFALGPKNVTETENRKIKSIGSSQLLNNGPHSNAFSLAHTCVLFMFET